MRAAQGADTITASSVDRPWPSGTEQGSGQHLAVCPGSHHGQPPQAEGSPRWERARPHTPARGTDPRGMGPEKAGLSSD